jgi:class 3 adenylate cyclase
MGLAATPDPQLNAVATPDDDGGVTSEDVDLILSALGTTRKRIDEAVGASGVAPDAILADIVLARGATLTAKDLAARFQTPVEAIIDLWTLLGVVVRDPDRPFFSEVDAELTATFLGFKQDIRESGGELLRVLGSAMARVAESAISLYIQTVQQPSGADESAQVAAAVKMAATLDRAVTLGNRLGGLFAHHLRGAIDLQRSAQTAMVERSVFQLAVGFIDLVGSTPLTQRLRPRELVEMVGQFEATAFSVVSAHGGRVVKYIGDEIMFVTVDPAAGCRIAAELMTAFEDGSEPRGGLAYGEVVTRFGDYFGAVVNKASRLAELAIPREVLVDNEMVHALDGALAVEPAGHRQLRGFADPVAVSSLVVDGATS